MSYQLLQGDCVERMAEMPEASVDAVVCDPPYLIGFMGRDFDTQHRTDASHEGRAMQAWHLRWATEALRVLKPGGHLLAFGGTRTSHRLTCAIEDAGFEIRDSLLWLYGSGFPKSLDVSKAIDKAAGAEREVVGMSKHKPGIANEVDGHYTVGGTVAEHVPITAPATPEAAQWQGWGTALKPSHEPIIMARKPLSGTVAETVLRFGTGAINVDACRVRTDESFSTPQSDPSKREGIVGIAMQATGGAERNQAAQAESIKRTEQLGRWPANTVLSHLPSCQPVGTKRVKGDERDTGNGKRQGGFADVGADSGDGEPNAPVYGTEQVTDWRCADGCPVRELDAQSGELTSGSRAPGVRQGIGFGSGARGDDSPALIASSGGASRFFATFQYVSKASRSERNAGLEGFEEKRSSKMGAGLRSSVGASAEAHGLSEGTTSSEDRTAANSHPTVKPLNLMRWLVRLVTPPDGVVLDCFLGSGSTGCAAVLEGFDFIGIERESEYLAISEARIAFWAKHEGREVEDVLGVYTASQTAAKTHAESGQEALDLEATA